jgi:hypothetical protein
MRRAAESSSESSTPAPVDHHWANVHDPPVTGWRTRTTGSTLVANWTASMRLPLATEGGQNEDGASQKGSTIGRSAGVRRGTITGQAEIRRLTISEAGGGCARPRSHLCRAAPGRRGSPCDCLCPEAAASTSESSGSETAAFASRAKAAWPWRSRPMVLLPRGCACGVPWGGPSRVADPPSTVADGQGRRSTTAPIAATSPRSSGGRLLLANISRAFALPCSTPAKSM